MAQLKNAPNVKRQDFTGESLVTICLGIQAWDIAKHIEETGKSAVEIELESAFGDGDKNYPCVVVGNEILADIANYRLAPQNARNISLIQANYGTKLDEETLERVYIHLAQTTQAETVQYYNEAGSSF